MNCTSLDDWKQWIGSNIPYNMLPFLLEVDWHEGLPLSWERFWDIADPYCFVLESGRDGRYTYLGIAPRAILTGVGDEAVEQRRIQPVDMDSLLHRLSSRASGQDDEHAAFNPASPHSPQQTAAYSVTRTWRDSPFRVLRDWMSKHTVPNVEGKRCFTGGCVGYIGYDVARSLEKLPEIAVRDVNVPDYAFMVFDHIWVYDHEQKKLIICVYSPISREMTNRDDDPPTLFELYDKARRTAESMLALWSKCVEAGAGVGNARRQAYARVSATDQLAIDLEHASDLVVSMTREAFTDAVERIREYIRAGDVFQVNLSVRQQRALGVAPEIVYEWLRWLNPSPYMGMLRMGSFSLVSGSPELLLKKEGRKLRTRPIAGTRRRGRTPEEDRLFEQELLESEKERAEHVMLVDLERNDIGRVAKYGTVKVDQLMVIERYSHVMHLVSEVSGELSAGRDGFDALAAAFPGGTITGAPKVRTMQIIEELEPVRRGVYTGSFGWIDYNGDMEFNIIIRTLLASEGKAYVQAGAGIVIDSVPVREYRESLSKAKALWKAVEYAERAEADRTDAWPNEGGAS